MLCCEVCLVFVCNLHDRQIHLHEQDLESNLHYSLRHEVAMFASIAGSRLNALKQYVKALAKVSHFYVAAKATYICLLYGQKGGFRL